MILTFTFAGVFSSSSSVVILPATPGASFLISSRASRSSQVGFCFPEGFPELPGRNLPSRSRSTSGGSWGISSPKMVICLHSMRTHSFGYLAFQPFSCK